MEDDSGVATTSGADKVAAASSRAVWTRCLAAPTLLVVCCVLLLASLLIGLLLFRLPSDYYISTPHAASAQPLSAVPAAAQRYLSASLCPVEDSIGYWIDDNSINLSWYVSLPSECRLYPFLHQLMQLPQPAGMGSWPGQTFIDSSDPKNAIVDPTAFMTGRLVLWITDSIDRHPLAETCSRLGNPHLWGLWRYPVAVSADYGLTVCHQPRNNLTLVHAQTFGLHPDNEQAAMQTLIDKHIPATLAQVLSPGNVSRPFHALFTSAPSFRSTPLAPPVHPCEFQPAVPDVLVVHSCRWDELEPEVVPSSPQHAAFAWWMKRFETQMLIPTLYAYSQQYRLWQHDFIMQLIVKQHNDSRNVSDAEVNEAYQRSREQLFTLQPHSIDHDTAVTLLAPNPYSHPIEADSDVDLRRKREASKSPVAGCPDEPFIVIRNCAPPRADLSSFHERETTRAIINAATRAVSRQYGIRLLDMSRMLDGIQNRPNFMWDFIHWNARPWLQTFNVLLNMYKQHLVDRSNTAATQAPITAHQHRKPYSSVMDWLSLADALNDSSPFTTR